MDCILAVSREGGAEAIEAGEDAVEAFYRNGHQIIRAPPTAKAKPIGRRVMAISEDWGE